MAGIEIIHHGVRTATRGGVRLQNTPEQWDLVPIITDRKVDRQNKRVEVSLRYKDYNCDSKLDVTAKGNGVEINVYLDKPLSQKLVGKAGFNLEFLPASYFEKTYLADGKGEIFRSIPQALLKWKRPAAKSHNLVDSMHSMTEVKESTLCPSPLPPAKHWYWLAPEDPERLVKIQSPDVDLMLLDGRNTLSLKLF